MSKLRWNLSISPVLDNVDRTILNSLQRNGRVPYSEIAKKAGVAEATIRYRIKRLQKKGVIRAFTAILNPTLIGFSISGAILMKLKPAHVKTITEKLIALPETSYIYRSTGEYDIVTVVYAHDINHFNEFVKKVKMINGVKDIRISVTTELIKANPTFIL